MNTQRKIALGVAGAAIVAASTFGIVASHAEPTAPAPTTTQQGGFGYGAQAGMTGHGRMGGDMGQMGQGAGYGTQGQAAYLAERLGTDEAALTKALADYRASHTARVGGRDMDDTARIAEHESLATYLAEQLELDRATVLDALNGMDEARQAVRTTQIKTRLDDAVKAGSLTQTEADAIVAAHESGAMGGFGRGNR